jgi:hypothetical protein
MLQNKIKNFLWLRLEHSRPCVLLRVTRYLLLMAAALALFFLSSFAQEQFTYDAKAKRNPFIPLVTSEGMLLKLDKQEASGDLTIEGIIYDKNGRSYAIVNATVVEIGGSIGDYQVLKIEEKKVIFIKQGQIIEMELKEEKL